MAESDAELEVTPETEIILERLGQIQTDLTRIEKGLSENRQEFRDSILALRSDFAVSVNKQNGQIADVKKKSTKQSVQFGS